MHTPTALPNSTRSLADPLGAHATWNAAGHGRSRPPAVAYTRIIGILRALEAHPQIVPPSLDVAAARADLDALDALRPLLEEVQRLHAQLEDTVALLGHDVMDVAYDGYQQLKLSGAAQGLEDLRRELGAQFSRRRRDKPEPAAA